MIDSFGILYEDTILDVTPGENLTVEWMSSFFNEERIFAGSYSYPILLPFTEKNMAKLGNPHLLENRQSRKKVSVMIQLFGQSWKRGEMYYDVTPAGLNATILIDVSVVAEWMRERSLASVFTISNNGLFVKFIELLGKGSESENKQWVIDSQNKESGSMPFVFAPIRNDMATGEMIGDESAPYQQWLVNPYVNRGNDFGDTMWTPFFYLHWVIREVCGWLGFSANGSFLTDDVSRNWVLYNTGIFHSDEFKRSDFAIQPAKHMPDLSVADFFKLLRNDFQIRIYFDSYTKEAFFIKSNDILQTTNIKDLSGTLLEESLTAKYNPIKGYELFTKIDDGDEIPSLFPYIKSFTIGSTDTPKSQELKSAFTHMYRGPVGNMTMRIPWVRQQPNLYGERFVDKSDYNPENTYGKNSFVFRLLSYRSITGSYPYLSSDDRDTSGEIKYEDSVSAGGKNGFLSKYCQGWYNMLNGSEQIDFRAKIRLKDFLELSPLQRILISTESFARTALLLDRVTVEPSSETDVIDARILGFAQYNIMAISDFREAEFKDGEIITPEIKVFARLVFDPNSDGYYVINKKNEKEKRVRLYVRFYKDSSGTIPYEVTNMDMYFEGHETSHKAGTENTRVLGPVRVSGSEAFLSEEMTWRWVKSTLWNGWTGTDRTQTWRLIENGKAYTVI